MPDLIAAMESAVAAYSAGQTAQPVRTVVEVGNDHNFFGVMPAAMREPAAIGAKLVTVFHANHTRGLPSHLATIVLFDPETGALAAVLDGRFITEARTAAVSAVSAKHLARPEARTLAIIGAGVQARSHLRALRCVRAVDTVRVWSPSEAHRTAFAAEMSAETGLRVTAVPTSRAALDAADLIVLATSSPAPVIDDDAVAAGAHVCAVGACRPEEREMPTALVARARVFVDSRAGALKEAGDILLPMREGVFGDSHIAGELGDVVRGRVKARAHGTDVTIFKSLGMAIEDIAAAELAVSRARERGVGREFSIQ
jgi:ornithine cyclodeaminase